MPSNGTGPEIKYARLKTAIAAPVAAEIRRVHRHALGILTAHESEVLGEAVVAPIAAVPSHVAGQRAEHGVR